MNPATLEIIRNEIVLAARELSAVLMRDGAMIATAESCTAGLIAAALTDASGSSQWFERGWATYSNQAKVDELGVEAHLLEAHGAVSEPVVRAMAVGALNRSRAQIALAVTGIAGPTGGSADKPVGTVWFGWAIRRVGCSEVRTKSERVLFAGSRETVRLASVRHSLQQALQHWMT